MPSFAHLFFLSESDNKVNTFVAVGGYDIEISL